MSDSISKLDQDTQAALRKKKKKSNEHISM